MRLVIVSTLGLDSDQIHGADRILTLDTAAPVRWRRAEVRTIPSAGIERIEGLTIAWGHSAEAVAPMLKMRPGGSALVVVLAALPTPEHSIYAQIERWISAGVSVHVVPVPAVGAVFDLTVNGRHVSGVPPLPVAAVVPVLAEAAEEPAPVEQDLVRSED